MHFVFSVFCIETLGRERGMCIVDEIWSLVTL